MCKTRRLVALAIVLAAAGATAATAADRPSSRDTLHVIEYYYGDDERPVLMSFKLCRGVHDNGPSRYECRGELGERDLEPGMRVYVWMNYLVPRRARPTITLRVEREGARRDTWSSQLQGAIRFRTWHAVGLDRAGHWRVEVYHENGSDPVHLYSRSLRID